MVNPRDAANVRGCGTQNWRFCMHYQRTTPRQRLVAEFGGRCERCGYNRCLSALQFHHRDASEKKKWSYGRGHAAVLEIKGHPDRFLLLCANCHFEEHEKMAAERYTYRTCLKCGRKYRTHLQRVTNGRSRYCSHACQWSDADHLRTAVEERFWRHVEKSDGCWLWTGFRMVKGGYGEIQTTLGQGRHRTQLVHRLSYEIHYGPMPKGTYVRHTCGIPHCVNPEHLSLHGSLGA
jgi:hypothetical protein